MAAAALLGASPRAVAQAPPGKLPGNVEPGRRPPPPPTAPEAPLKLRWIIRLPPGPRPPETLAKQTLTLRDLVLDGVTVYRRSDLLDLFRHLLGKEITFGRFYAIARDIQARYHRDGYLLSFAYVPPQTVADDVFRISVVEGYVDRVVVEGAEGPIRRRLETSLAAIARSRPLEAAVLERTMLLANDLAGISATGVLQPSETARGASDLVVKVDRKTVDASARIDNRGSDFAGPWRGTAVLGVNSLLDRGERLTLHAGVAAPPRELTSGGLVYSHPLGGDGLRVDLAASYVSSDPGSTLAQFDIETTSYGADLDLSYPVIRARAQTLSVGGGLSLLHTAVDQAGAAFTRDRLRTIRASLAYSHSGFLGGGSGLRLGATQALPVLDATDAGVDTMSRADADPAFTRFTLDLSRRQPLFGRFGLLVAASAQVARSPLPAAMEFSLGGARYGRAYDAGEITGEHGVAASVEAGYDLSSPSLRDYYVERVRPYGFYDVGKAWDKRSASSDGLAQLLASAGVGVRVGLMRGATLDLEFAYPLTRTPSHQTGGKSGRFFVVLGARF